MKLDTTRKQAARQLAGTLAEGSECLGLIVDSDDGRDYSALVRLASGHHVTMIDNVARSIDPAIVRSLIDDQVPTGGA